MKKIDLSFFILGFITLNVAISDIFIRILDGNFLFTNFIVALVLIIISYIVIKKEKLKLKSNFSKIDLIFIIGLLIYMAISIVFPDLSWDTRSYHIYLQENAFSDKLNSDFFAGRNLNSFLFCLGDRVNYLFRLVLGYRLGTVISYFLILVLYYQVKRFLRNITNKKNTILSDILSMFIPLISIVFAFSGTYYIDNFGLIFLLEIFLTIFEKDDIFINKLELYFIGLYTGISLAIKVTNMVFLIPLGIFFIILNFKNMKQYKVIDYIIFMLFAIIPWIIYGIDNYMQTGNPVFPYYNNIFKSEYFMLESWKDNNFGPENLIQFLIWPIYICFNPNRAFDTKFVDFGWGIGFIAVVLYIVISIKNKNIKNNKIFWLSLIVFVNYYLWEKILIGYVRYATLILILSYIIFAYALINSKKNIKLILTSIFVISLLPSIGYDLLIVVKDYTSAQEVISEYRLNFGRLIKDRNTEKIKVDGAFGAIGDDSLLPVLLKENNNIYNLEEWVTSTNEKTFEMYNEKIKDWVIYVPIDERTLDRKELYLKENNFEVLNITEMNGEFDFLSPTDKLYLYEVKKK